MVFHELPVSTDMENVTFIVPNEDWNLFSPFLKSNKIQFIAKLGKNDYMFKNENQTVILNSSHLSNLFYYQTILSNENNRGIRRPSSILS